MQDDKEPKIRIVIDNRQDLELFEFANAMSGYHGSGLQSTSAQQRNIGDLSE